uniref:Uncharacterized protein n=1 Tax=Oryza meridionalis TaxID=40149 RepID=A0A0E0EAM0_9ORYZ
MAMSSIPILLEDDGDGGANKTRRPAAVLPRAAVHGPVSLSSRLATGLVKLPPFLTRRGSGRALNKPPASSS